MEEKKDAKLCELCGEQAATVLCSECCKCYCDGCSEFVHSKASKKSHKTEALSADIRVDGMCPLHKNTPLDFFCLDEVRLCCAVCEREKLHEGHRVVKIAEIAHDSEVFSAENVRKRFAEAVKSGEGLEKKVEDAIESIQKEGEAARERIAQTFKEEHRKLEEEEAKIMRELEAAINTSDEALQGILQKLRDAREYSRALNEAAEKGGKEKSKRLMELDLASEMEKQRKIVEELNKTEMRDLKVGWDSGKRKLSFTRTLFNGVPAPSNITAKSARWDSITLTWDAAEGASFYQIEVDGGKSLERVTANTFTKRGLLPETEHSFRVRAVGENSVGEWSDVVKGRTQWGCAWKECPDGVDKERKYSVDEENPRIATKISGGDCGHCTIIGNTTLTPNKVTSLSIKILKSRWNYGSYFYIGVAPSDINQNEINNYYKCGWYFDCYGSTLWSGPPHNHRGKEYGPRKGDGEYVHTGDSVGVVMDTAKGELSFVLDGVNLGVAYEGIPLDKPLVPCVLLLCESDSVELVI